VTLGAVPNAYEVRWSSDGVSVAYSVGAHRQDDPNAGIWVTDFKTAPRHVFRGWVSAYMVDVNDSIYALKGKNDLQGELWKMKWDGSGMTRLPGTIPLLYNNTYFHSDTTNQSDVSPDGRHIIYQTQPVLQENIGIIDNLN